MIGLWPARWCAQISMESPRPLVEVLDPARPSGTQRNRHLGVCVDDVMMRCDPAIGGIDACSLTRSRRGMALALRLLPTSQALRQVCRCGRPSSVAVRYQARLLRSRLSLAGPPPLARRLRCLRTAPPCSLQSPASRRDVLDKMKPSHRSAQWQTVGRRLSANSEKARENVASLGSGRHRSSRTAGKACRQPQGSIRPRVVGACRTTALA